MGEHRAAALNRWTKVAAVIPLVLLTGAWTAAFASADAGTHPERAVGLPEVPTTSFTQPASNPSPLVQPLGVGPKTGATRVLSTLDATGIPAPTVSAYKRSETVLAGSDASCKLPWTLIAAIGRVESNHGRYGGNTVGADGVSTPGIYGIPLDGSNSTARITDTDSGVLDNDKVFDRAVGPMQFIPGTWKAVAVDGDNDGKENPQDINDAALATGVYLCSGAGDLSTPDGASAAVLRYNHSSSYVNLVLSIATRYAAGDFDSADLPAPIVPADDAPAPKDPADGAPAPKDIVAASKKPAESVLEPVPKTAPRKADPTASSPDRPAKAVTPNQPASEPTVPPASGAADGGGSTGGVDAPTEEPPTEEPPAEEPPTEGPEPEPCYVNEDGDGTAEQNPDGDVNNPEDGCLPPCEEESLEPGAAEPQEPCRNPDDDTVVGDDDTP